MQKYELKREIAIDEGYDIVVAGGGPAGTAAAVCAARLGAKVMLVEALGCLGGLGTSGIVAAFGPMANGEVQFAKGFIGEVIETLHERGYTAHDANPEGWRKKYHTWTRYNVEGLKLVLDELAEAAGVDVRFFTKVIDADVDSERNVKGVVISNVEGYRYIKAKAFVDATGDAVVADLCGTECRVAYRDTDRAMPPTLTSLWANCDWDRVEKGKIQGLLEKAVDEGHFSQWDKHFPGMNRMDKTTGYLNGGHLFKTNGLRSEEVSKAMIRGRKLVLEFEAFMKKYVPGFEDMEITATSSLLGLRETRNIIGEAMITKEDFIAKRQFPDQIGVYNRFMDVHVYDTTPEEYERFESYCENYRLGEGNVLGLPYGILVPKGFKNLWVAGRCVSSDTQVLGTIRAQPCCSIMGQAAGTAAVQSVKTGQPACELNTEALRETLRTQGVYLP